MKSRMREIRTYGSVRGLGGNPRAYSTCVGHGRAIGGESPLRGLSEATASQRQLHETKAGNMTPDVYAARPCGMEAVGEPQRRTQVNPCAGRPGLGKCARQHDARYPIEVGTVFGAAAAGHCSSLLQEISMGPPQGGSAHGGNDGCAMPMEKSDHPVVAVRPGNTGGAKGVTG